MVYQLLLESPENEKFEALLEINESASLFDLHKAILSFLDYPKDIFTSFIFCDNNFNVLEEINIEDAKSNTKTLKEAFSKQEIQLAYIFDIMLERSFFINLVKINSYNITSPELIHLKGEIPKAILSPDEIDKYLAEDICNNNDDSEEFLFEDTDEIEDINSDFDDEFNY